MGGSAKAISPFLGSLQPESLEVTESLEQTDSLEEMEESLEVRESLQDKESLEETEVGLDLPHFSTELNEKRVVLETCGWVERTKTLYNIIILLLTYEHIKEYKHTWLNDYHRVEGEA